MRDVEIEMQEIARRLHKSIKEIRSIFGNWGN